MYDKKHPTFIYRVNLFNLEKHFKEVRSESKYHIYESKGFFGAVIRTKRPLESFDGNLSVMSIRLKGRSNSKEVHQPQTVNGVKIDLMGPFDDRLKKYGIELADLINVDMKITAGVPGTILMNPQPALMNVFLFSRESGASVINIVKEK